MSDELLLLDLESGKWHNVVLRCEQQASTKPAEVANKENVSEEKETVTGKYTYKEVFQTRSGVNDRN